MIGWDSPTVPYLLSVRYKVSARTPPQDDSLGVDVLFSSPGEAIPRSNDGEAPATTERTRTVARKVNTPRG